MNIYKGSFFVFFQSYKKQMITFWTILLLIIASSFAITYFVKQEIQLFISISVPVYVFFVIIGSKFLTNTFNYLLRLGMSRGHYIKITGAIFIIVSLFSGLFLAIIHELFALLKKNFISNELLVIHPSYFFDNSLSFSSIFISDFVILLLCLVSGLITNYAFYRFGTVGGYSLIGLSAFFVIIAMPLEWYSGVYEIVVNLSFFLVCLGIAIISILLFSLMAFVLRELPAVPV